MIALWHQLPPQFEAQLSALAGYVSAYHFDDGYDDVLRAADALDGHGLAGVFFIVSGRVGRPGWASRSQLAELVARGHELGNHTRSHPHLTGLAPSVVRTEVRRAQLDLAPYAGHVPRRFAWPYGQHDRHADKVVARFGFTEVRGIDDVVQSAARKSVAEVLAEVVSP